MVAEADLRGYNTPRSLLIGECQKIFQYPEIAIPIYDFVLSLACGVFLGPFFEPLWGLIFGPAACGKSEFLRLIATWELTYQMAEITPKALISGYETKDGSDPSAAPNLYGMMALSTELNSFLSQSDENMKATLGPLSNAFGETLSKASGTTGYRKHDSSVLPVGDPRTL